MLLNYLKIIYYELKARLLIQKVSYKLEGNCIKCGSCCRYMYSLDTYTEKEFILMTKIYPKYRRFKVIGKDNSGNLIFACRLIDENGLCSDYKNRLKMCKEYPAARMNLGGNLHEKCGYKIILEKTFKDYLKDS